MRRLLTIGATLVSGACTERVDLSGLKADPNAFVGTWWVTVAPPPPNPCSQLFRIQFSIDADDAALANNESMSFVSEWRLPDSPSTGVASGNINWSQNTFAVEFERSDRRARFEGTNPAPTRLNGKMTGLDVLLGPGVPACGGVWAPAFATK